MTLIQNNNNSGRNVCEAQIHAGSKCTNVWLVGAYHNLETARSEGGYYKVETPGNLGWKSNLEEHKCLDIFFLQNDDVLPDTFNIIGSSFEMHSAATEKRMCTYLV